MTIYFFLITCYFVVSETVMSQVQRLSGGQVISSTGAAKPYLTIVTQAPGENGVRTRGGEG